MVRIGSYEAKTRLAELLKRAEAGERIVITRHGKDVAVLGPAAFGPDLSVQEAIEGLRELRRRTTLGPDLTVRDLIEEGRRW